MQGKQAATMASMLTARPLVALLIVLLALCGVQAMATSSQLEPCDPSQEDADQVVRPGDIVCQGVVIDSLDPVDEEDAFAEFLASRRLLQCRKCKCLPRCSRCLIMACGDGICTGLCRLPSETHNCELLRCSRAQES